MGTCTAAAKAPPPGQGAGTAGVDQRRGSYVSGTGPPGTWDAGSRRPTGAVGRAVPRVGWERDGDAPVCRQCGDPFSLTRRRHHCRACGGVFCGPCSSQTLLLEPADGGRPVRLRACDECVYALDPGGTGGTVAYSPSATTLCSPRSMGQQSVHSTRQQVLMALPRERWQPDADVQRCRCGTEFTVALRRHHCRACGDVVCAGCSTHTQRMRHQGSRRMSSERVCNECHYNRPLLRTPTPPPDAPPDGPAPPSALPQAQHAVLSPGPALTGNDWSPHPGEAVPREMWVADSSSETCMQCGKPWTVTRRRHHCRACGGLFCASCTSARMELRRSDGYPGPRSPTYASTRASRSSLMSEVWQSAVKKLSSASRVCGTCAQRIAGAQPLPGVRPEVAWMEGEWAGSGVRYSILRNNGELVFVQGEVQSVLHPAVGSGPPGFHAEAGCLLQNMDGDVRVWFRRDGTSLLSLTTAGGQPRGAVLRCERGGESPALRSGAAPDRPTTPLQPPPSPVISPDGWDVINPEDQLREMEQGPGPLGAERLSWTAGELAVAVDAEAQRYHGEAGHPHARPTAL